jgi:Anti-anti-sigma regulatory factor (antagonist of anti-sigma factor)
VEEAVFYKSEGATVYMKATGHVTALVCPPLKAAVFERLEAAPAVERVYLDLSGCEYMDSTFLGLIVGTQKRFARVAGGGARKAMTLLGVNEACRGLLRTIGVLGMVELSEESVPFPADLPRLSGETRASARFLLDAHEELSGLSDENRKRFSTLTSVLKSAVDAEEGKS